MLAGPRGRDFITADPPPQSQKADDVPRANVPFKLVIDEATFTGASDGDGRINVDIPPNAREGTLTLDPGTPNETALPIHLGFLNPITEISGVPEPCMSFPTGFLLAIALGRGIRERPNK